MLRKAHNAQYNARLVGSALGTTYVRVLAPSIHIVLVHVQ